MLGFPYCFLIPEAFFAALGFLFSFDSLPCAVWFLVNNTFISEIAIHLMSQDYNFFHYLTFQYIFHQPNYSLVFFSMSSGLLNLQFEVSNLFSTSPARSLRTSSSFTWTLPLDGTHLVAVRGLID